MYFNLKDNRKDIDIYYIGTGTSCKEPILLKLSMNTNIVKMQIFIKSNMTSEVIQGHK